MDNLSLIIVFQSPEQIPKEDWFFFYHRKTGIVLWTCDVSHVTFLMDQIISSWHPIAKHLRRPSAYFTIFRCLRKGQHGPTPHSQICLGLRLSVSATKFTSLITLRKASIGRRYPCIAGTRSHGHMSHPNINSSNHNGISSACSCNLERPFRKPKGHPAQQDRQ